MHKSQLASPLSSNFAQAFFVGCFITALLVNGCSGKKSEDSDSSTNNQAPARVIALSVLVVGDEKLGPVIKRQFSSRQNGTVTLTEMSWEDFAKENFASAGKNDVLVYPANQLGALAERDLLLPLNTENLPPDAAKRRSILFSDRDLATSWGEQTVAMSLGQSHWMLLCRDDALEAAGLTTPNTWKQFNRLVRKIRSLPDSYTGPRSIGVPLADHWAADLLALRAASAIRLPGKYSSFFDVDSMEPLVASEPFSQSLTDLQAELAYNETSVATAKHPAEVFADYCNGKTAIALVPLNRYWSEVEGDVSFPPSQLTSVPCWTSYFDRSRGLWIAQTEAATQPVPLTQTSGMLCSVSASTQAARDAIEMAAWMTNKQISSIVAIESPNAGLSLKSHLGNPEKWLGGTLPRNNATQFADVLFEQNESNRSLNTLRISGRDRYMAVLSDAVRIAILEGAIPGEALRNASLQWAALNDELGADAQKRAYRRSEGLRE